MGLLGTTMMTTTTRSSTSTSMSTTTRTTTSSTTPGGSMAKGGTTRRGPASFTATSPTGSTLLDSSPPSCSSFSPSIDTEMSTEGQSRRDEAASPSSSTSSSSSSSSSSSLSNNPMRSFPPQVTALLNDWLRDNSATPYPSKQDLEKFIKLTNLSKTQLTNWFANARRRTLKDRSYPRKRSDQYLERASKYEIVLALDNRPTIPSISPTVSSSSPSPSPSPSSSPCLSSLPPASSPALSSLSLASPAIIFPHSHSHSHSHSQSDSSTFTSDSPSTFSHSFSSGPSPLLSSPFSSSPSPRSTPTPMTPSNIYHFDSLPSPRPVTLDLSGSSAVSSSQLLSSTVSSSSRSLFHSESAGRSHLDRQQHLFQQPHQPHHQQQHQQQPQLPPEKPTHFRYYHGQSRDEHQQQTQTQTHSSVQQDDRDAGFVRTTMTQQQQQQQQASHLLHRQERSSEFQAERMGPQRDTVCSALSLSDLGQGNEGSHLSTASSSIRPFSFTPSFSTVQSALSPSPPSLSSSHLLPSPFPEFVSAPHAPALPPITTLLPSISSLTSPPALTTLAISSLTNVSTPPPRPPVQTNSKSATAPPPPVSPLSDVLRTFREVATESMAEDINLYLEKNPKVRRELLRSLGLDETTN
eukprot:TRINITY_DN1148_c2_g2_i1.p1 TRINITY_DN1148_c2_g2~~TRINITY_DN1148_c2_g2_i1.p1  ORF type:complete len:635 (+),score=165.34 TRINITY_DN1148_c2_g2_i1:578-2482(+)